MMGNMLTHKGYVMAKSKAYKEDDVVESYGDLYTVHSHTDVKELLAYDNGGELCTVQVKSISRHWVLAA